MPDNLRIVQAQPADFDRYIDVMEEVSDWLKSRGIEQWWPHGGFRRYAEYYAESLRKGEAYLVFLDNDLVGAFRLLAVDDDVWPGAPADALYLYSLAVRRNWSGREIGRRVLDWVEQQSARAGKTYVRLDCFANNSALRNYYENAGYASRGEVDAKYDFGTLRLQRYEKKVSR